MERLRRPIVGRQPGAASALAAGGLLVGLYVLLRHDPRAEAAVYQCASLGALGAIILRGRAFAGAPVVRFLTAGVAAYAAGDLIWAVHNLLGVELPWAYLPDAAYLACYPLLGAALVGLAAGRRERSETCLRQLLDAALLFVSAFTAFWFFALAPHLVHGSRQSGVVLTIAYPTLDLALLSLAGRGAFSSGRWPASYALLTGGFACLLAGDLGWRWLLADGGYTASSWINTLFIAGYALWAAAALHPSFAAVVGAPRPASVGRGRPWRRLVLLILAAGTPALVLAAGIEVDDRPGIFVFAAAITLIPVLGLLNVAAVLRTVAVLGDRAAAARDELRAVLARSPIPIAVVDRGGIVRVWNGAAENVSGWSAEQVVGRPAPIFPMEDESCIGRLVADALGGMPLHRVEATLAHRDGHAVSLRVSTAPLHTPDGRIVALFEDVTVERRQAAEIEYLATFDPLTSLPNRHQFKAELVGAVEAAAAGLPVQVALLDIDGFKTVNDSAGHAVGDRILRDLAGLVRISVRAGDFVARSSGDEFGVIFRGVDDREAELAVQRVLVEVRDYRLRAGDAVHDVTLSAGLYSLEPEDTPERALRRVDEALYEAKQRGKNRSEAWASALPEPGTDRIWSAALKDALRDDRIDLFVQPIVSLRDGRVAFAEALARVRLPDAASVPACEWIDAAERLGLMPHVDERMIEKAEAALLATPGLRLFVNLSASSFHNPRVLGRLEQALETVRRGTLGIEITEHTTLSAPDVTAETLARLRTLGAEVAIDDFGLGFTSFTELAGLPCDLVKIPGEFASQGRDLVIVSAITAVAHHFGKRVVVEGVEDGDLAARVAAVGAELAQGWHFGRPEPVVLQSNRAGKVEAAA